jgi:hypothetical protein
VSAHELPVIGQPWAARRVVTFHGQHDSHIPERVTKDGEIIASNHPEAGKPYSTLTLHEIFTMEPGDDSKASGRAFIPSTYHEYDARAHKAQREHGTFVSLTADIDSGNHPLKQVQSIIAGVCRDAAWLIYSSAHARPGDMRWRIIIPLAEPLPFEEWEDAQNGLFNALEGYGIDCDRVLARAGQPVYLPNVPAVHGKTGEPLRDDDGVPRFFERATSGCAAPGFDIHRGPVSSAIGLIKQQREAEERDRQRLRAEAEKRRAMRPASEAGAANIIDEFNTANSITTLLQLYGYQQSPRNPDDWRSPMQTGESYATRVMGDKWVSLSASDAGARVGEQHKAGCYGDAYDLFLHFEHGGDHKSAFRQLYAERRASQVPVLAPPPEPEAGDPGWTEPPEGPQEIEDIVLDPVGDVAEPISGDLKVVDAFDFDEAAIPPRPWVIPGVLLSGYTHMLVAPGGSGKSLFTLQLAITLATGQQWGEMAPRKRCRTLVINVEDDMQEQRRRLAAARRVMGKDVTELRGMIALAEDPESIIVARADPNRKTVVSTPVVDVLRRYIIDNDIGVLIVDPFAETFEGDENSNSEVKWAMRIWRDEIARATGCAVYLVHHTTKGNENGAGNADIVRGAGAIVNSTRITATLMPMTTADADAIGIDPAERFKFVRYDDAKANQSLKSGRARWFEKIGVTLDNGTDEAPADEVGALRPWTPPSLFDGVTTSHLRRVQDAVGKGRWRENQQATDWVGKAVAEVMMLDHNDQKDRKRIVALLKEWVRNDALRVVEDEDEKRMTRKFVVVGKWV